MLSLVPLQANHNSQNHLNNVLRHLRHWHIHDLLHDSFRHPLLRNHLDHFNTLPPESVVLEHPRSAQFVHVHPCCRLTLVRALWTTSPATSSWHIHHLLHDAILHALPWHMLHTVQDLRHRVCHDLFHNDLFPTCDKPLGEEEHSTTTCATTCTEHHVNQMTTCLRTSRMQATSHIPKLCVLRDV